MATIKLGRRELVLSPRLAVDVLELAAAVERREKKDDLSNILSMVQIVSDSLKATGKRLSWYRKWPYRRFMWGQGIHYIIRRLTSKEIVDAYLEVMECEGVKKKELFQAVRSGAMLRAGSSLSSSVSDSQT